MHHSDHIYHILINYHACMFVPKPFELLPAEIEYTADFPVSEHKCKCIMVFNARISSRLLLTKKTSCAGS